jgi:hypothetical protein
LLGVLLEPAGSYVQIEHGVSLNPNRSELMKKLVMAALVVVNVAAFGAIRASTQALRPDAGDGGKACCKKSVEGAWFCCSDCCTFTSNCKDDTACKL